MHVSLYSGPGCWLIVPAGLDPIEATKACGPLQFEGTVPSHFIPSGLWSHLLPQCDAQSYALVPEDLGVMLLDRTLSCYGTLTIAPQTRGP